LEFEGFPFNIGWELTLTCNLRCSHCASAAGSARSTELTTAEALRICDQFPELLVQEVDLTGGEPLLRKDWSEIATHLRSKLGISVNILTNGWVVNDEIVRKIKSVGIATVGISLDGLENTHDHIRGRSGSFQRVIDSIKLFNKHSIRNIVITTVNSANIPELPELKKMMQSLHVSIWRLQPLIPIGRAVGCHEIEIDSERTLEIGNFIRAEYDAAQKSGLQVICSDGLEYIEGTTQPNRPWRGCPAGWTTCGITSDGKVKSCLSLPDDLIEGDLRKARLWDIWFAEDSFTHTRRFELEQAGHNCSGCDKLSECKGGCSASSYAATGGYHNDPYCYYKYHNRVAVLQ
jgi:radical SAM protein with 4Fe4S-binding SPASM domain